MRRVDTENKIASNILKVSPICSSNFTIFSSAIGSTAAPASLYTAVNIVNFIIGIAQIAIIITTPKTPHAFFKIPAHPKTVST